MVLALILWGGSEAVERQTRGWPGIHYSLRRTLPPFIVSDDTILAPVGMCGGFLHEEQRGVGA